MEEGEKIRVTKGDLKGKTGTFLFYVQNDNLSHEEYTAMVSIDGEDCEVSCFDIECLPPNSVRFIKDD